MVITYWSDFACPYCYIGIARMKRVIREMGTEDKVSFERKSFQLRKPLSYGTCPACGDLKEKLSGTNASHFAAKYKMSEEKAAEQFAQMSAMGAGEGLEIRYATAPLCYTEDAHRLVKFAEEHGGDAVAALVSETLFYMYLTQNYDISDQRILLGIAKGVGLNEQETIAMLTSDDYGANVQMDSMKADMLGIHVVPYFLLDGKYYIEGVQSDEYIREVLKALL